LGEVGGEYTGVGGGDPPAAQVGQVGRGVGAGGEPEGGGAEVEVEQLHGRLPRVHQQVPAGDAELQITGAHIGGDVPRAQVEELHPVVGVGAHQLPGVGALTVAGFAQHLGGRRGQGALVGHGDTQHGFVSQV